MSPPAFASDRTRGRRRPPAERRRQILDAAVGCFSARGYHTTTMDDLVAATGLSKGSLYWHFDSKEAVFLGCLDRLAEALFARVDAAARAPGGDVLAALARELVGFFEQGGAERRWVHLWTAFSSQPRAREHLAEIQRDLRARLAALVRRGIEQRELREMPVEEVAGALAGVVDALLLQAAVDPGFEPEQRVASLWDILSRGVVRR